MTVPRGDDAPACLPPLDHPSPPSLALPPGSCDAHFHVFGPRAAFPFSPERTFTPQDAPKERLFALHRMLGFERGVFVQSACHGSDHAVLLDLLAAGAGRYRGVALLTPQTADAEIAEMHAAGVCGARFHFFSHLGAPTPYDEIRAVIDRIAPLVRERLGLSAEAFPLARVLEGGTWSAGRRLARERRADGGSPIRVVSDGTVF